MLRNDNFGSKRSNTHGAEHGTAGFDALPTVMQITLIGFSPTCVGGHSRTFTHGILNDNRDRRHAKLRSPSRSRSAASIRHDRLATHCRLDGHSRVRGPPAHLVERAQLNRESPGASQTRRGSPGKRAIRGDRATTYSV
jgi:hypothetical protein